MIKTFLSRLWIGFSIAALAFCSYVWACAGDFDFDFYSETNFTPEVFVAPSYKPMMLSANLFYNGGYISNREAFHESSIDDWTQYLGAAASREAVAYFILDSTQTIIADLEANRKVTVAKKIDLENAKVRQFIRFLSLAKKVEAVSTQSTRWLYEPVQYEDFKDEETISSLLNTYKKTQDGFLKNRYWFQVVKAYFYSVDKGRAIVFFNETEKAQPKNELYYRALAYVAGVFYKQKDYGMANYLFAKVFDASEPLRLIALFNFHPQEEADWQQTLRLCKSGDERAAVWALHGYYADEAHAIQNIFKEKPDSPHLDFLLIRLVNKYEIASDKSVNNPWSENGDFAVSPSPADLVSGIADSGKALNPFTWHTAAGYLQTIEGNFKASKRHYEKAALHLPGNKTAPLQLRLLRVVDAVSQVKKMDRETESRLLPELVWLFEEVQQLELDSDLRRENAAGWARQYLSGLYCESGNDVMAELFVRKSGFYTDAAQRSKMKAFLEKPGKTGFEELAVRLYSVSIGDIYHYEAVEATLNNKVPEALALMRKSGKLQSEFFYGNPFLGNIQDCHDCDHAKPPKNRYSHLRFLETLQEMQDKIRNEEDIYTNSLLLGNAFYNITHFGNGRSFYQGNIFLYYEWGGADQQPAHDVTDCTIAEKYYRQALAWAKTDEQKAKCHYLLAKCERNRFYNQKYGPGGTFYYGQDDGIHFLEWEGFKALKGLSKTRYYKDVVAECGYFKTYMAQQ